MEQLQQHTELIKKLVQANPKYSGNEDLLDDFCSETYQKSYLILQTVEDIKSLEAYMQRVASSAIMDVLKNNGRIASKTRRSSTIKTLSMIEKKSAPVKKSTPVKKETAVEQVIESKPEIVIEEIESIPEFDEENINFSEISDEEINSLPEEDFTIETNITDENIVEDISFSEDYVQQEEQEVIQEEEPEQIYEQNKAPLLSEELLYVADPRENVEEQVIFKETVELIINSVKEIDKENPEEKFLIIFRDRYFYQKKQKEIAEQIGISQAEVSKRLVQLSHLITEKLKLY